MVPDPDLIGFMTRLVVQLCVVCCVCLTMTPATGTPSSEPTTSSSSKSTMETPMFPPPQQPTSSEPQNEPPVEESQSKPLNSQVAKTGEPGGKQSCNESRQHVVPYTIPPWSEPPGHNFYFEVLKEGSMTNQVHVYEKGAYIFGSVDLCDFVLEHPTVSRFHAVLQFKRSGEAYIYDLASTHGTFINNNQVNEKSYVDLHVGDVLRFGQSSTLYIFRGPPNLMPTEADLERIRNIMSPEEVLDREASLQRVRREASVGDGVSWSIGEDATKEAKENTDEETWQTYKGQLTQKQPKTREKDIMEEENCNQQLNRDDLAESLNDLFTSVFAMVKSEVQGSNNNLELLEKMNLRIAEEYNGYGDVASGLRVFVEQLKSKSSSFDEYARQIDTIEQQVIEFEAVISMLDRYVSMLESKLLSATSHTNPSL
ncbi:uncharacterized protein LOC115701032 isoform X2 [Cannabis sativa]|uniref:uncharacterized protein LOC115701032 isoform X2 n=1 Tax=Cannabis sativa TaxID=3483 RepID=UPI0029CAAAB2|nr:uncharacterized protein LOC115701032 isoform X2 [Cannabis sativa]